mmetsp:Transcript_28035/g.53371  ORF Transcript_28035/g.53371 Transcript_28035/m.53371 type:complete len:196 (-) Transcript_28035:237-824(-)
MVESANIPEVQELCRTNVSKTIQEFPDVPLESLEFILGTIRSCNASVAPLGEDVEQNQGYGTTPLAVPEAAYPPPWPSCHRGWNCRRTEETPWYKGLTVYFIIGIIPMFFLAYTITFKYRHHPVVAYVRTILGIPDPPEAPDPGTQDKVTELSSAAVRVLFVGIVMPDGQTVVGTADEMCIAESAHIDDDACLAV